jgi:hypothetical protein
VQSARGQRTATDSTGHYLLPYIPGTSTTITGQADGFAKETATAHTRQGGTAHVNLQLVLASVQSDVQVGTDATSVGSDSGEEPTASRLVEKTNVKLDGVAFFAVLMESLLKAFKLSVLALWLRTPLSP